MEKLVKDLVKALDGIPKGHKNTSSRRKEGRGKSKDGKKGTSHRDGKKKGGVVSGPPPPLRHGKRGAGNKPENFSREARKVGTTMSGAASTAMSAVPVNKEVLHVEINPIIVFQYIHGVLSEAVKGVDTTFESSYILGMTRYYASFLQAPNNSTIGVWPRKVLELAAHLRSRVIGEYSYAPDWEPYLLGIFSLKAAMDIDRLRATTGLEPSTVGGTPVDGFMQYAPPDFESSQVSEWQNNYAPALDLVNLSEMDSLDDGSASAFTWSGQTPIKGADAFGGSRPHFIVGATDGNPAVLYFVPAAGQAFCEVKPTKLHLAGARFCTMSPFFPWTAAQSYPQHSARIARHSSPCTMTPRAYGAYGMRYGKISIKQVPSVARIQTIIDKMETLGDIINNQSGGVWSSSLGANDVKMYAQYVYRKFHSKFAASNNGCYFVGASSAGGGSVVVPDYMELHVGDSLMSTLRIPEEISNHLGASDMYMDKEVTLIPWVARYDLVTLATRLTYTGVAVYPTIPAGSTFFSVLSQRAPVSPAPLFKRFKKLEQYMTGACNMRLQGSYGPTLLDTSVLQGSTSASSFFVTGLVSRRKITDVFLAKALSKISSLTYVSQDINPNVNPYGQAASGYKYDRDSYDHQVPQKYRYDMSGLVTPGDIAEASMYDGFVRVGLTTNMSGNDGPDLAPNARPIEAPVRELVAAPEDSKKEYYKYFMDKLVPTKGKYCGPSWTAGVDSYKNPPVVDRDGKYLVPPTDKEDEICKSHDEAYNAARGDQAKLDQADDRMVEELGALRRESGLSPYGLGAMMAISAKRRLWGGSPRLRDEL